MASDDRTPALRTNPKAIFFTDFDGTITLQDSNDYMIDNLGFGKEQREINNGETLNGGRGFRYTFYECLDSIKTPFDECMRQLLANIKLDPKFLEFFLWCRDHNVPIVVISGGMRPVVHALLSHLLGEENAATLQIVSNDVKPKPGKSLNDEDGWEIEYHDDSPHGHDKSLELRPYAAKADRPVMFYAGDGVSDLSAAKETDLLFAKAGKDLVFYCEKQNVPFTVFHDFGDIQKVVAEVVEGKKTVQEAATGKE